MTLALLLILALIFALFCPLLMPWRKPALYVWLSIWSGFWLVFFIYLSMSTLITVERIIPFFTLLIALFTIGSLIRLTNHRIATGSAGVDSATIQLSSQ